MSVKLTVIYDNPADPRAFEEHYRSTHVPLAGKVPGVRRAELAKVFPKEDGSPTPAYRVAELYFDEYGSAVAAIGTPEGKALLDDAQTLGRSGVKFLLCDIER
ncbi:MAG: EthD family reductase [Candidatus Eremiobacteraeota bacterium]|nr:EthD family reductase [Candidatus Eremiobacteraeota bacterium]MBC5802720.1 EthD family reductase [Candidatus Eremiobacteraeota bacterium]MBC5821568.1 EthD family reductase [Candidatus Eremiobacteraeota bacterium]